MRRNAIYLTIFLTCFVVGFQRANAAPPTGPCHGKVYATPHGLGAGVIRQHVKNLIGCATDHWSVEYGEGQALCVAERESGYWPWAVNSSSGAAGIYQHLPRYWEGRARLYLRREWFPNSVWPPSPFRARANVLVSIRLAHAVGWYPWGGACR